MLMKPTTRISRSSIAANLASSRFTLAGLMNGIMPSMMKTMASAANRSVQSSPTRFTLPLIQRPLALCRYLKNSPSGVITRMSPSRPSVFLYACRLR